MDFRNHVHRHSGNLTNDSRTNRNQLGNIHRLRCPGEYKSRFSRDFRGLLGSCLATLAVSVPSFFLVLYSSHFIRRHSESGAIKAIFSGLRPVVVGLIASAAILLMNSANFNPNGIQWQLWVNILICALAFCLAYFPVKRGEKKIKIHPIFIIILVSIA